MELLIVIVVVDTLIIAGLLTLHVVMMKHVKRLDKINDLIEKIFGKPPELF